MLPNELFAFTELCPVNIWSEHRMHEHAHVRRER